MENCPIHPISYLIHSKVGKVVCSLIPRPNRLFYQPHTNRSEATREAPAQEVGLSLFALCCGQ